MHMNWWIIYTVRALSCCGFGISRFTIILYVFIFRWHSDKHIIAPAYMMTSSTFSVLLALCAGNSPVTGEFPSQRPMTRSFDVFFDLRLNKRLSKQSRGWRFETQSRPLCRHSNGMKQYWIGRVNKPHGLLVIADTTSIIKQTTNYVLTLCSILYIWDKMLHICHGWCLDLDHFQQHNIKNPDKAIRGKTRQDKTKRGGTQTKWCLVVLKYTVCIYALYIYILIYSFEKMSHISDEIDVPGIPFMTRSLKLRVWVVGTPIIYMISFWHKSTFFRHHSRVPIRNFYWFRAIIKFPLEWFYTEWFLTHLPLVPHICVGELRQHWFR